ncbi:hypothetical protein ACFVG1_01305 [Streptomyces bacillaris]|uniref:Uncharacterized protein n=2 Tax=Streptomyces TaxID=1883 RepID=A0A1E7LMQ6_9ACTN|nr:hypothetical protein [Streptomyces nanshensis]OEV17495.1 hypothetical protein AN221_28930 [Streptomyces nanshensis]
MSWYWWVLIFFWIGGFTWTQDTVRKALRKRHKRKLELLKATTDRQLALEAANRPPEPVCGCTHHLAKHDKQGRCHEQVEVATAWDENRKPLRYEAGRCTCQQYVGPQPLSQVYAEELTDRWPAEAPVAEEPTAKELPATAKEPPAG